MTPAHERKKGQQVDSHDALVIGAGPSGLIVAHALAKAGLSAVVCEKGPIASHISQYPTQMRFFSTREKLQLAGFPLVCAEDKPTRIEYLAYLTALAQYHELRVHTYTEVLGIERVNGGGFDVRVKPMSEPEQVWRARHVVTAVGAWENTRRLGAEGEDLPKVHRRFTEAHLYVGRDVLVVGGANSAVETALLLHRAGARVTLCHHDAGVRSRSIKYWLKPDIENRIASGEIRARFNSHVERIADGEVTIRSNDGARETIRNDFVLPMIGYNPPAGFLRELGMNLDPKTGVPEHNPETLETNVPGLFIAGVLTAGNIGSKVFIENMLDHGEKVLRGMRDEG